MPDRRIRSIIRGRPPITVSPQTTVAEAARLMKIRKVGALLVVDGVRLIGIFTERDALLRVIAEERDPHQTPVANVMTPDPQTVDPDKPFGYALHLMHEGGFRHVPVVENGWPLGVVSARDVLGSELREFATELQTREHIEAIL
jgi:CBS domain-containing protein